VHVIQVVIMLLSIVYAAVPNCADDGAVSLIVNVPTLLASLAVTRKHKLLATRAKTQALAEEEARSQSLELRHEPLAEANVEASSSTIAISMGGPRAEVAAPTPAEGAAAGDSIMAQRLLATAARSD
jgi:hypothetical protein